MVLIIYIHFENYDIMASVHFGKGLIIPI